MRTFISVKTLMIDKNEWLIAHQYLDKTPDGTKLPYSIRPDGQYKNGYKPHKTTHSFIKIDGKIYGIAQGKSPAAVLGAGTFGKVKLIEDEQGNKLVVKIEQTNHSYQQNEFQILKDQKIAIGKAPRQDKTKYYTVMNFMGLPLRQRLKQFDLQFFVNKPDPSALKSNTVYLYLDNNLICCGFHDYKNNPVEKILSPKDIGEKEYLSLKEILKNGNFNKIPTDVNQGIPFQFIDHRATDDEIKKNCILFYPNQGEMRYSFADQNGTKYRHPAAVNQETFETIFSTLGISSPSSLTEAKRLDYAIDICLQLANLHEGGSSVSGQAYAHLDIKSDNIVVNKEGRAFLIDFGLSHLDIKAVGNMKQGTEMNLPWCDNGYNKDLTREQLDILALKRTLFLPSSYYGMKGHYITSKETQKKMSMLTEEMLNKYNLTAHISTEGITDFTNEKMSARMLAAILIKARKNLASTNDQLINDPELSINISSKYERDLDKENAKFSSGPRTKLHKKSNEARETLEYNNNHYEIVDGALNFTNHKYKKFASTGAGREAILLDVADVKMQAYYKEFSLSLGSNPLALKTLFDQAIVFSNSKIRKTDFDYNLKKSEAVTIYGENSQAPVFTLQEIIANQKGVCRHHALFVSFLLGEYFKQKPLKNLSIHHCRDTWKDNKNNDAAHAWVICRQDDKLTLIDALWKKQFNLTEYKDYTLACKTYPQEVIDKIFSRAKLTTPGSGLSAEEKLRFEEQHKHEEEQRKEEQRKEEQRKEEQRKEEQRKEEERKEELRNDEEKRIAKDLEEFKQRELVRAAERVISKYEMDISALSVWFRVCSSVKMVQVWQTYILQELDKLVFSNELTGALKTLNIKGQHPKILKAIATKTNEIDIAAQSWIRKIEEELRKGEENQHKREDEQRQEEEKRLAEEQEKQLKRAEQQKYNAEQVINSYEQKIKALFVNFNYYRSVDQVNRMKKQLFADLNNITSYSTSFSDALIILNGAGQHLKILEAISIKTKEINSAAESQINKIEEEQRQEEEKRLAKEHEAQKRKREEDQQRAEQVINSYEQKINNFNVQFYFYNTSVSRVNAGKRILLNHLNNITLYVSDLSDALRILNITEQHPKIIDAISKKTNEINTAAELLISKIEEEERLEEEKRLVKEQEEKKWKHEEQLRKAEQIINLYEQKIFSLAVPFNTHMSIGLVKMRQNELLEQLDYITFYKADLTNALETLNITGQHPKISNAISNKTDEINSAAQSLISQIEKREQEREAELVINSYERKIDTVSVQFKFLITAEQVNKQKENLFEQLNYITLTKSDLTDALKTLNISGQHPKIIEAISKKTKEINFAAQLQQSKIEEKEQKRNLEVQQKAEAEQVINFYEEQINQLPVQFGYLMAFDLIYEHQKALLEQVDNITFYRDDLISAIKTLNITGQHPKIRDAIDTKIQEITIKAQLQLNKVEENQRQDDEYYAEELKKQQKYKKQEPNVPNRYHQEFNMALDVIKQKRDYFESNPNFETDPKIRAAYWATNNLCRALEEEGNCFFTKEPTRENYEEFKSRCDGHISEARYVLDNHRGWGKILLNVFAMIATAGIGYAIAAVLNVIVNRGKFTFFSTDSSQKISAIEEKIEEARANIN